MVAWAFTDRNRQGKQAQINGIRRARVSGILGFNAGSLLHDFVTF